jgi:hypothetical protein
VVQNQKGVKTRQITANVPDSTFIMHLEQAQLCPSPELFGTRVHRSSFERYACGTVIDEFKPGAFQLRLQAVASHDDKVNDWYF